MTAPAAWSSTLLGDHRELVWKGNPSPQDGYTIIYVYVDKLGILSIDHKTVGERLEGG